MELELVEPPEPPPAREDPGGNPIPRPCDGLEIPTPRGSEDVVVALPSGRLLSLSADAARFLRLIDGRRSLDELARLHAAERGRRFPPAAAGRLIRETFVPAGLVHFGEPAPGPRLPRSRLWLRLPLIPAGTTPVLARRLAPLLDRRVMGPALAAALGLHLAFYLSHPRLGLDQAGLHAEGWLAAVALYLVGSVWHELGHTAALRRYRERPGAIGLGMYYAIPVFHSDVTRAWLLPRRRRAVVDLGGMMFQALFAGALCAAWLALGGAAWAKAVAFTDFALLLNLNPFLRMDGYWLVADLTGKRDWRARAARAVLRGLRRVPRPGGGAGTGTPVPGLARVSADLGILGRAVAALPRRRRGLGGLAPLLPVSFSTALSETHSPRRLRALARRYPLEMALNELVNHEVPRGRPAHRVENPGAILPGGTGVLVCALHLGPFHQITAEILRRRDAAAVFASRHVAARLQDAWRGGADAHGKDLEVLVSDERRSVPRALRVLAAGGCVIVYVDADNRVRGLAAREGGAVDVSFLGLPFRVSTGPARLAARAGASTVFAAAWRERGVRAVVRFSAPLPPLAEASEHAVAGRVRASYAWFEPLVRARPEQWDGWLPQVLSWSETGRPPSVSRARFEAERKRIEALVRAGGKGVRLAAEPAHVGCLIRGEERLLVHGPRRLILKGDRLTGELLEAALRRRRLHQARRVSGEAPGRVAEALTRLELAGLVTVEDRGR